MKTKKQDRNTSIAVDQSIIGQKTNQQINFKTGSDFVGWMWTGYWHLVGQTIGIEASS